MALAQDDTFYTDNSWVVDQVQAPSAWETSQGEGITVAVMDTGVGQSPVFEGKDVLPGFSLFSDEPDGRTDNHGHGTAIAAGVLLAAPEATIMPVRFYTGVEVGFGGVWGDPQHDAFRRAVDEGADVLVLPWGLEGLEEGQGLFPEDLEALQYAIDKGAIIIAGAGNDPDAEVTYPAAVPGIVAVTGTDRSGAIWSDFLTTGPEVALAAPADQMTAPVPEADSLGESELYTEVTGGTSMASAVTAGVAALTWSAHPDLDASNVIQRMLQTAGDGSGDRDDASGYGLVNADQAVNAEGIEPVEENPLGYPMGEPGASGATPDDPAPSESAQEPGAATGGPSAAAEGNKESNLNAIIVVAAAVILVGAAVAVWLVLRGRNRKAAAQQQGQFNPGSGPAQAPYQQAAQQPYVPPTGGGQGYGGPPPGQGYSSPPQGFSQPGNPGEPSPPWRPSEPNQR
ncbi:S8 family serine peptidase [Glycomyces sp. NPDC047369]